MDRLDRRQALRIGAAMLLAAQARAQPAGPASGRSTASGQTSGNDEPLAGSSGQPAGGIGPAGRPVRGETPVRRLVLDAGNAPPADLAAGSIFFVGTATVLIRHAGFTILTDPNFLHKGEHVHLGYGLTSRRLTNPAIELDALPPIDLVVLSHMHGDHFDQLVQKRLRRDVPIVTTPHAARALSKMGFTAPQPLSTWQALMVVKGASTLQLTSMPGRHGPPALNRALPPVMGSLLEFGGTGEAARYRIYLSGDTLVYQDIQEIPKRFPNVDLALLHLGGTRILKTVLVTMDAKQGVRMLRIIEPRTAIPIHYDDYTVFKSPLSDFQKAVRDAGLADKVRYLDRGDSYRFEARAAR